MKKNKAEKIKIRFKGIWINIEMGTNKNISSLLKSLYLFRVNMFSLRRWNEWFLKSVIFFVELSARPVQLTRELCSANKSLGGTQLTPRERRLCWLLYDDCFTKEEAADRARFPQRLWETVWSIQHAPCTFQDLLDCRNCRNEFAEDCFEWLKDKSTPREKSFLASTYRLSSCKHV